MKIIKFPGQYRPPPPDKPPDPAPRHNERTSVGDVLVIAIKFFVVLTFPFMQWIVAIDCVFQLLRWMLHPGFLSGARFWLHIAFFCGYYYFAWGYQPKCLRDRPTLKH